MGIEEDMENMFRYFSPMGKSSPVEMVKAMMRSMEVNMLKTMKVKINVRLEELSGGVDKSLDPFAILGVDPNSPRADVEAAYKKKAWSAHPDRGGSNQAMAMVNAAREAIFRLKGWGK